jgi:Tol biopolymer transport system component
MTPERWRKIECVYHAALELKPDEREAYIEEACRDDQDLRREIESLVRRDNSSPDAPMNRPAWFVSGEIKHTGLAPGTRLGPYEIEHALGAGGMGEVYKGRDTRLNRPVAIKLLRAQFSDRLEREARAISALNHPQICTLYDVGPNFLVMEFLEGETLASRLEKGPLPVALVCQYGARIASALAVAHRKGFVHRDLKPANIMLTKMGVKVLDFGLAKGAEDEHLTQGLLGTPAYMSPEQREGKACDPRTDIFSLGLILREMAIGKGITVAWPEGTPHFAQLVDRCLRSDPDDRWQSATDLENALELLCTQPPAAAPLNKLRIHSWNVLAAISAILILTITAALWKRNPSGTVTPSTVRLVLEIPPQGPVSDPDQLVGPPAISPDGKVVVVALTLNGSSSLWIRRLDSDRFEQIEGTQGIGDQPFWSPDGKQIGFFADGKLKKVKVLHGKPETVCETPTVAARGGAWSRNGVILFGVNYQGLMKVPETGGEPVLIAGLDRHIGENSLRFPQFLADGNRFIYFSRTLDPGRHAVYLDALDTAGRIPRKKLTEVDGPSALGHDPVSNSNFLVYPKGGQVWAQRLDETTGLLAAEKYAIADDIGDYSLSDTGTLVFRRAISGQSTIRWVDRTGNPTTALGRPGDYWDVSLSPDEHYAAVINHASREGRFWVDLIDLARNVESPFSDLEGRASGLVWARDSHSLYFTSWGEKQSQILSRRVDSTEPAHAVITSRERYDVKSVGPDGTFVADHRVGTAARGIGFAQGGHLPWRPFAAPDVMLQRGQFSPDGKWLLYQSNESGAFEVYVSDFPGLNLRRRVSVSGGSQSRWARDGREIFYVTPDNLLMSLTVLDPVHMVFSRPRPVFKLSAQILPWGGFSYDVARDSKRFLLINTVPSTSLNALEVVLNWPQLMRAGR